MKISLRNGSSAVLACASLALTATATHAQGTPAADDGVRIERLQQQLTEQAEQIKTLKQSVAEQEARHRELQRVLGQEPRAVAGRAEGAQKPSVQDNKDSAPDTAQRAVRVGTAPNQDAQPPAVAPLFDQPGILTARGKYILEPSVQYSYASSNRVALVGYTVIPALLIGLVDVREVKRSTLTAALTTRYGLTNRLELEAKLPYVYRSDSTISREILGGTASDRVFDTSGMAFGDFELGRVTRSTTVAATCLSLSDRCG